MTRQFGVALSMAALMLGCRLQSPAGSALQFAVTFPSSVHTDPITGRLFVLISHDSGEPREMSNGFSTNVAMYAIDVSGLRPGEAAVISDSTPGYPLASLRDIPPGDYWVQAVLNVYTQFKRSDGHTIWAHMDQWEGQNFTTSPGNLISDAMRVHIDPAAGGTIELSLTHVLPPIQMPADTKWVKHIKIQSPLLTKFWG